MLTSVDTVVTYIWKALDYFGSHRNNMTFFHLRKSMSYLAIYLCFILDLFDNVYTVLSVEIGEYSVLVLSTSVIYYGCIIHLLTRLLPFSHKFHFLVFSWLLETTASVCYGPGLYM